MRTGTQPHHSYAHLQCMLVRTGVTLFLLSNFLLSRESPVLTDDVTVMAGSTVDGDGLSFFDFRWLSFPVSTTLFSIFDNSVFQF